MLLKVALLLLLCAQLLEGRPAKTHDFIKKVGRRYLNRNPALTRVIHQQKVNAAKAIEDWLNQPDEFFKALKKETAAKVAKAFRWQSSILNDGWAANAKEIIALGNETMTADICGGDKLDFFAFNEYMRKQRLTVDKFEMGAPYYISLSDTPKETIKMTVQFEQKAGEVKSTAVYIITMTLQYPMKIGNSYYKITHVSLIGGCPDHGTSISEMINLNEDVLEKFKPESNADVKNLFELFAPGSLKHEPQNEDEIPQIWLMALETGDKLDASVHHPNEESPVKYTKDEFLEWYKKFGLMWHPKKDDKDFTTVYILDVDPAKITARVSMRLQIGREENATVYDWSFKITTEYNLHDDQKWYISSVEVSPPPNLLVKLMDLHLENLRDVIADRFEDKQHDLKHWYLSIEFLKEFTHNKDSKVEYASCGTSTMELRELEKTLWVYSQLYKASMHGCWTTFHPLPDPASEETFFKLRMIMSPVVDGYTTYFLGSDWTFFVKWDKMYQFYYVEKISMECPRWMDNKGNYRPLKKWKIYIPDKHVKPPRKE